MKRLSAGQRNWPTRQLADYARQLEQKQQEEEKQVARRCAFLLRR